MHIHNKTLLHALPNSCYSSTYCFSFISVFNDSAGELLLALNQSQYYYVKAIDVLQDLDSLLLLFLKTYS